MTDTPSGSTQPSNRVGTAQATPGDGSKPFLEVESQFYGIGKKNALEPATISQAQLIVLMQGGTIDVDGKKITGPLEPLKVYIAENYDRCDHSGFRIGVYLNEETAKKNTQGRDDSYDDEVLNTD